MTRHEAAVVFIRLRDIIDQTITAGIAISPALGAALNDAGRAYDELTYPKPDLNREPIFLLRQGRRLAPPAKRDYAASPR